MTREEMKKHGISAEQLAYFAGLTKSTVDRYLSGGISKPDTAEKIEMAFFRMAEGDTNPRPITSATYVCVDIGLVRGQSVEEIAAESLREVDDIRKIADWLIEKNRKRYGRKPAKPQQTPTNEIAKISNTVSTTSRENNTSGVTGVFLDKKRGMWLSKIAYRKKKYFLWYGDDYETAVDIRKEAEKRLAQGDLDEWYKEFKQLKPSYRRANIAKA